MQTAEARSRLSCPPAVWHPLGAALDDDEAVGCGHLHGGASVLVRMVPAGVGTRACLVVCQFETGPSSTW